MEQKFALHDTLIPVDDYYVLIDKKADTDKGWILFEDKVVQLFHNSMATGYGDKIIAATKRIGNLPLVEIPDEVENTDEILHYVRLNNYLPVTVKMAIERLVIGYKAVQGTFSEEDMRKAYIKGWEDQRLGLLVHEDVIQSLQKKKVIKSVVLEIKTDWSKETKLIMEGYGDRPEDFPFKPTVKINTETNTITPKKIIYE